MTGQDLDLKKGPVWLGHDGSSIVGWEASPERRCAACGAPWVPVPGRAGVQGCSRYPLDPAHLVVEDTWGQTSPTPDPIRRPVSKEVVEAVDQVAVTANRLLEQLEQLRRVAAVDGEGEQGHPSHEISGQLQSMADGDVSPASLRDLRLALKFLGRYPARLEAK